jgi:hypothetical protein
MTSLKLDNTNKLLILPEPLTKKAIEDLEPAVLNKLPAKEWIDLLLSVPPEFYDVMCTKLIQLSINLTEYHKGYMVTRFPVFSNLEDEERVALFLSVPSVFYDVMCINLDQSGLTKLTLAFQQGRFSPEQMQVITKSIIKHYKPEGYKTSILHWALKTNDLILKQVLDFYQGEARLQLILPPYSNETVLHVAAHQPEYLKVLLESLPEEQRLSAVSQVGEVVNSYFNKIYDSVLYRAAINNPESLKTIVGLLPEGQKFNAIKTVLHGIYDNPQALEVLLNLLPEDQRLEAIFLPNKSKRTVLHVISSHNSKYNSLKALLAPLSKDQLLLAINTPDIDGRTVMHLVADKPEYLRVVLELLVAKAPSSLENLLQFVPNPQKKNTRLLDIIATEHPALLEVLAPLPGEQKLELITIPNESGNTLLHLVANRVDSFKAVLAFVPLEHRLEAIMRSNKYGMTVLHVATGYSESFIALLELLPIQQRLEVFQRAAQYDKTLSYLIRDSKFLKPLLELLPKDQLLDAFKVADQEGNTILHWTAARPNSIIPLLTLLPAEQMIEAVKVANQSGDTVLHAAARCTESLSAILELYPEDNQQLDALNTLNKREETVTMCNGNYPESKTMLKALQSSANSDKDFKLKEVAPILFWRSVIQSANEHNNNNTQTSSLKS